MHKVELEMLAKQASGRFLDHGDDLSESIFQLAGSGALNDEQVQRVIEMTNTMVNGHLVKQAKANKTDPRLMFKRARREDVEALRANHAPAADAELDKVAALFRVPDAADVAGDDVFTKTAFVAPGAADLLASLSNVDATTLAHAYVHAPTAQAVAGQAVDLETMEDAAALVSETVRAGRVMAEGVAGDMEDEHAKMAAVVEDLLLVDNVSPATLRAIAGDHARLIEAAMAGVYEDQGIKLAAATGQSQVAAGAILNPGHPFVAGLQKLAALATRQDVVAKALAAAQDAEKRANADLRAARTSEKTAFLPSMLSGAGGKPGSGVMGKAMTGLGMGLEGMGAASAAADATRRLKAKQLTPAVGALKMAEAEKEAAEKSAAADMGKVFGTALMTAGAFGVAAAVGKVLDAGLGTVGRAFKNRKQQQLFADLARMDPEFDRNPRARESFDIIAKFAPAILKSPRATYDFIKKQLAYPQSSVEFLQQLSLFQKQFKEGQPVSPGIGTVAATSFGSTFAQGLNKP